MQHDKAYEDFKDLARRAASDKVFRDKAFNIAKSPKYDGYQRGLAFMVYKFFDKNSKGRGVANKEIKQNRRSLATLQLDEELHKPIIRNFQKRTVYSGFKENTWGSDLPDMQLLSKFNLGFRFLLCIIDIFSKYAWVAHLKNKIVLVLLMLFKKY